MASIGTRKNRSGGLTYRSIRKGTIIANRLHPDVLSGGYLNYNGRGQPLLTLATMAAVASGADTVEHIAYLGGVGGVGLHYWPIGAVAQAVKGPQAAADGLRLDFDAFAGDGANYVPGGLLGPFSRTIERTAGAVIPGGVFIRWQGILEDVSGAAEFAVGFRKSEAIQALIDGFDEMAALNVQAGTVNTETILNNAATVTRATGKTWADTEEHELVATCAGNGKVAYYFDGSKVGVDFQFDDGEVVVPFMHLLLGADLTTVNTKALEVGSLEQLQ
jgi:hypothetical protein